LKFHDDDDSAAGKTYTATASAPFEAIPDVMAQMDFYAKAAALGMTKGPPQPKLRRAPVSVIGHNVKCAAFEVFRSGYVKPWARRNSPSA
jgi:hypothetical protein